MSIDTAAKRRSMLNFGYGGSEVLLSPGLDTVDQAERLMRVGLYSTTLVAVHVVVFGPPFLDMSSVIRTTLGVFSDIVTTIGRSSKITDMIERLSRFSSSRISRSAK